MTGSLFSSPLPEEKTQQPPPLVLVLLGPPGSGKGTQAVFLRDKFQIPHISTGDLLREHIRRGTELGKKAQQYIDKGQLVPDSLIMDLLFDRVSQKDCAKGYILDGFPRTMAQAQALQDRLQGKPKPFIFNLDLKDNEIIERLTKRVSCEQCGTPYHLKFSPPKQEGKCDKCGGNLVQRSDDTKEVISKRLKVYHEQTSPLIRYYESLHLLHTVNCEQTKDKVFESILSSIP
ncbi:MAG TPA: adenylate kinase [Rhabdochlamydiaceae bacterium]